MNQDIEGYHNIEVFACEARAQIQQSAGEVGHGGLARYRRGRLFEQHFASDGSVVLAAVDVFKSVYLQSWRIARLSRKGLASASPALVTLCELAFSGSIVFVNFLAYRAYQLQQRDKHTPKVRARFILFPVPPSAGDGPMS